MVVKLLTLNKPHEVELKLNSNFPQNVNVIGYDKNNQKYFDRNVYLNQPEIKLRFGCPITPNNLYVKINANNKENLKVTPKLNNLGSTFIFDSSTREFVEFIQEFCTNYHKYKAQKTYYSRSKKFKIVHLNTIGETTPARIHKTKHFIEVGKDYFKDISIPMRVFILCHEYAHIYMNTVPENEFEADINGAKLYLKLNYPIIELLYSFTKIFGESPETIKRSIAITNYVKQYD
tara:strand:- start:533 stop:1231 length:699 start_codon:yes stop_codon:yes gene_type:complete